MVLRSCSILPYSDVIILAAKVSKKQKQFNLSLNNIVLKQLFLQLVFLLSELCNFAPMI